MLVCEKVIPIVHRLEQVSSGEHVGSLAENLLEALRSQPQCAAKVQQVRDFTRQVCSFSFSVIKCVSMQDFYDIPFAGIRPYDYWR